jgi:CRP/FNR family transcriptional regulator, cyclic AMP receptor protein
MKLFRQGRKVEALARTPLFAGLSKKELRELARMTDDITVEAGDVLCKEGELGREFFVIMEGEAEVTRKGKRLEKRGGGDFFGEIALIEDTPRTATVKAKTPLRLFVLTSRAFRPMLDDHPAIERKVLRALAKRLVSLTRDPSVAYDIVANAAAGMSAGMFARTRQGSRRRMGGAAVGCRAGGPSNDRRAPGRGLPLPSRNGRDDRFAQPDRNYEFGCIPVRSHVRDDCIYHHGGK